MGSDHAIAHLPLSNKLLLNFLIAGATSDPSGGGDSGISGQMAQNQCIMPVHCGSIYELVISKAQLHKFQLNSLFCARRAKVQPVPFVWYDC